MLELQVVELSVLTIIPVTRLAVLSMGEVQQYLASVAGEMALEALQRVVRLLSVILAVSPILWEI